MRYNKFQDAEISMLGMGTMRLPMTEGQIDMKKTQEIFDYMISEGVNYFDTAYPYHDGKSENATAECLKKYPRESYFLADKFPGHQLYLPLTPEEVFEDQLKKCDTTYFDFYLLHNVNDSCYDHYTDKAAGVLDYFDAQRKNGRIRHLGFSTHGTPQMMENFINWCEKNGTPMEFCQIQLNYLDWTLQNAEEKVRILNAHNIPVWVMEPVRGGKLADLPEADKKKLAAFGKDCTDAAWAMQWLMDVPGVVCVLSGMTTMEQAKDNAKTFAEGKPLTDAEKDALYGIAEGLKAAVPCTGCRYCTESCPIGLDIPRIIELYNDLKFQATMIPGILVSGLGEGKTPYDCLQCGACAAMCPQGIDIPSIMTDMCDLLDKAPNWQKICRDREDARLAALEK